MRFAEYALFLIPIVLALAWFYGIRGLSRRGVVALVLLFGAISFSLFWFGADRAFVGRYVPARLVGDQIIPGHPK